jgi:drug/metabolite transporter (DMT)-like permease
MHAILARSAGLQSRALWFNLALISGAWGSSFLFVKLISHSIPPFAFACARGGIAVLALLTWLRLRETPFHFRELKSRGFTWHELRHMAVLGTTNGWFANVMTVIAVTYAESTTVAMVQATVPLMVAVLAHFLFVDERLKSLQCIGLLVGLTGTLLILSPMASSAHPETLLGIAAMLVTALSFACGTVYARHIVPRDPAVLACGQQAFGSLVAAIISLSTESWSFGHESLHLWLVLIVIGVFCSALPTALYLRLLARTTAVPASLVAYLQPVWAALLGWTILSEHIRGRALLGTLLVFLAVFISSRPNPRR